MEIGIALPNAIPGTDGALIKAWSARAEERGFASLAATDRLVFPGHDPMLALATAAGRTQDIRLATNILVGPLRSAGTLAKECETLQSLSGGRFTLGVGPGVRDDDFQVAERSFTARGAAFDAQLAELHDHSLRFPAGSRGPGRSDGGTGWSHHLDPAPMPVPLMIAGLTQRAVRRVVRYGAGWTAPGLSREAIQPQVRRVRRAWSDVGRAGQPRILALARYSLGDDVVAESARFVADHFAVTGEDPQVYVNGTPSTPSAIRAVADELAAVGVDELVFHPTAAALSQVDRLADVLLTVRTPTLVRGAR